MTTLNGNYNGIEFKDVNYINVENQPWCPLEHTEYEGHCRNEYHNVQLRGEEPCEHSIECFNLRATLNNKK